MQAPIETPPPSLTAFFFDFDGTLVEIAATPDSVRVAPSVVDALGALSQLSGGAVAIISGRDVASVDRFLAPLRLPVAGLHGAERRNALGQMRRFGFDDERLVVMENALEQTVRENPGMLLEIKGAGLALHYRNAPSREAAARHATETLVARYADVYTLQPGKMVYEIKPKNVDKGRAIAAFMREAPFAGRMPLFAGDDLTDERGFALVNDLGGQSIKVGAGDTAARSRVDSVSALLGWLSAVAGTTRAL